MTLVCAMKSLREHRRNFLEANPFSRQTPFFSFLVIGKDGCPWIAACLRSCIDMVDLVVLGGVVNRETMRFIRFNLAGWQSHRLFKEDPLKS